MFYTSHCIIDRYIYTNIGSIYSISEGHALNRYTPYRHARAHIVVTFIFLIFGELIPEDRCYVF